MVKIRGLPCGRVVARLASLRKIERYVVRVRGLLVIRQVAADACRRCVLEMVLRVTSCAFKRRVHSRQRVARVLQVIESDAKPVVETVALLARSREPGRNMAGRAGRLKILRVT